MPNVLDPEQLNLLRNWSGELRYLQNFKLVRFTKAKLEEAKNIGKTLICNEDEESKRELMKY